MPQDRDKYRRDIRDPLQFKRDIEVGTKKEREIMEKFARIMERNTGQKFVVQDNGCGNSGRWMPAGVINTRADFLLNGKPFEVKFSDPWSNTFHFKVAQIDSYIHQNSYMLFVNGYNTSNPKYVLLTPNDLRELARTHTPMLYWEKACYEVSASEFKWEPFY